MKTKNPAHRRERNTEESLVGQAHHALRAHVKAFNTHSGEQHTFKFSTDRRSASILNAAGEPVLTRTIAELAAEGANVRFGLAALRDIKDKLESGKEPKPRVRYSLDISSGAADLVVDGELVTAAALKTLVAETYRTLTGKDPVGDAIAAVTDSDLTSMAGWAKIGAPISALLFAELESAEDYGLADAAAKYRERAYRLGLIRRPVEKSAPQA